MTQTIPFPRYLPEKRKYEILGAFLAIAKIQKQPKATSREWINKLRHAHTRKYDWAIKTNYEYTQY